MDSHTKEVVKKLPPPPPQLVQLIEASRQKRIAMMREKLDELLKIDPLSYVYEYDIEVLGDVAEAICGERVCRITGDSQSRWMVSFQGHHYTEKKVGVEIIYEAFDPERVNDERRLK